MNSVDVQRAIHQNKWKHFRAEKDGIQYAAHWDGTGVTFTKSFNRDGRFYRDVYVSPMDIDSEMEWQKN